MAELNVAPVAGVDLAETRETPIDAAKTNSTTKILIGNLY